MRPPNQAHNSLPRAPNFHSKPLRRPSGKNADRSDWTPGPMAADDERMYRDIGSQVEAAASGAGGGEDEGSESGAAGAVDPAAWAGVHLVPDTLCVSCGASGETRMLPTRIPFFREVIICAFTCDECGFRSSDVMTGQTQTRGCRFELVVHGDKDLSRQLLKSDKATVSVPELALEIPHITQSGKFTTVEGLLTNVADDLERQQPLRYSVDPAQAEQIDGFIRRVRACAEAEASALPFTVILDDPSGNSFLENPFAPSRDPHMHATFYRRSPEQDSFCGLNPDAEAAEAEATGESSAPTEKDGDTRAMVGSSAVTTSAAPDAPTRAAAGDDDDDEDHDDDDEEDDDGAVRRSHKSGGRIPKGVTERSRATPNVLFFESSATAASAKEVVKFDSPCSNCGAHAETRMCVTDVPHFKEVILMALVCPHCGHKDVEVRGGGAVPEHGTVHRLTVSLDTMREDMRRDVIKSDTAMLRIPEVDLELAHGSLGGMYTTVEGLMDSVRARIVDANPFASEAGDSDHDGTRARFDRFLVDLQRLQDGLAPFTLEIIDPMANSWIYSALTAEGKVDPRLEVIHYTRSEEEDTDLGLRDMRVDEFPSGVDEAARKDA